MTIKFAQLNCHVNCHIVSDVAIRGSLFYDIYVMVYNVLGRHGYYDECQFIITIYDTS
jgi:hypothetical protein